MLTNFADFDKNKYEKVYRQVSFFAMANAWESLQIGWTHADDARALRPRFLKAKETILTAY